MNSISLLWTGMTLSWAVLFFGCSVHRPVKPLANVPNSGWITVSGTCTPKSLVETDPYGISLFECVSRSKLTLSADEDPSASLRPAGARLRRSSSLSLDALRNESDNRIPFRVVSERTERRQKFAELLEASQAAGITGDEPRFPASWSRTWPLYSFETPSNAFEIEAETAESVPAEQREACLRAFNFLRTQWDSNNTSGPAQPEILESVALLSKVAAAGDFEIPPVEKLKAWIYGRIFYEHQRFENLQAAILALTPTDTALDEPERQEARRALESAKNPDNSIEPSLLNAVAKLDGQAEKLVKNAADYSRLLEEWSRELELLLKDLSDNSLEAEFVSNGNQSGKNRVEHSKLFLIRKNSGENFLIPSAAVCECELGNLWLMPGDQVYVVRFGELGLSDHLNGELVVGLTGMVSTEGIVKTSDHSLRSILSTFHEQIDFRSNILSIACELNGISVQAMLPYQNTSLSTSAGRDIDGLIDRWKLADGSILKLDHSLVSPPIVRSKLLQRRAAEIHANAKASPAGRVDDPPRCSLKVPSLAFRVLPMP